MWAVLLLSTTLVLLGAYCHYLFSKIEEVEDSNQVAGEMIESMARELQSLGSKNVFFQEEKG